MLNCPSDERFNQFLNECLNPAECATLEKHLARCARCQQRLQELTSDPSTERWRELLAQLQENQRPPTQEFLDRLVSRSPDQGTGTACDCARL